MKSILEGGIAQAMPATSKEPALFGSLEAIADNFGATDPKAAFSMKERKIKGRLRKYSKELYGILSAN